MSTLAINYYLLALFLFCMYATYRTYKKGHPFTLLSLVIFNCGLLCLQYSKIIYIGLDFIRGSFFSHLMFPLGLLVFYRNLHTKSINRLDKVLLGIVSVEYVMILVLNLIVFIFSAEYFDSTIWIDGIMFLTGDIKGYSSYLNLRFFLDVLFFYLQAIIFPFVIFLIYKGLVKAKEEHLNFFVSDSFHFYRWNFTFFILVSFCYITVAGLILYMLFIGLKGPIRKLPMFLVGVGGIGFGLLSYFTPELLTKEKDFPKLLNHLDPNIKEEPFSEEEDGKFDKYKSQLIELLENEKCYQDSKLSLATLAEKMEMSTRHLSRIINTGFGKSFSEMINHYRIEEVKSHLTNPEYEHYAILSIGLEAGFNSKTSFYKTFKKYTSLTPVQYKKLHYPDSSK